RGRDGPDHGVHAGRAPDAALLGHRPLGIRGLIYHYLSDPEWVLLSEDQIYVKEVEHLYCLTPKLHKEATLYKLLEYENPASSMIFRTTKEETRPVHTFLPGTGLPAAPPSSD